MFGRLENTAQKDQPSRPGMSGSPTRPSAKDLAIFERFLASSGKPNVVVAQYRFRANRVDNVVNEVARRRFWKTV